VSKSVAIIGTRGYPSYYGGFETLVRRLAPYLVESGWQVTVYGRDGATVDNDPSRDTRVNVVRTRGIESKSLSTLSYGLTASVATAVSKPDVALVMNVANGYWLPILRARAVPIVLNVDGIEWERSKWGANAKKVFRGGAYLSAKFANELVYDAEEIGRRWRRDFGRSGTYIPYGGDEPESLATVEGLRSRGYVLMVARFVPENTVPEFLAAAERISEFHDVVIVGTTGYGGDLDAQASALEARSPRVRWLGHVSDDKKLFSLWQNAGVYFHGHSVGGTNPALVQAMACGAPVVARDTVYNREVLAGTGTFVRPYSHDIADAILSAMSNREELDRKATAAQIRARKFFSWESVCDMYDQTLTSVARGLGVK
jgi:glycosyltransferase involved in cell wall biosynthesis